MTAAVLIRDLANAGIRLSCRGDKLHVEGKPGTITAELKAKLIAMKPALLELLADPDTRPLVRFRLSNSDAWATAIGRRGESVASLIDDLKQRWDRVEVMP